MKVSKTSKGFLVGKDEKQLKRESIKNKSNPTNKQIVELLELILEKLEGE